MYLKQFFLCIPECVNTVVMWGDRGACEALGEWMVSDNHTVSV